MRVSNFPSTIHVRGKSAWSGYALAQVNQSWWFDWWWHWPRGTISELRPALGSFYSREGVNSHMPSTEYILVAVQGCVRLQQILLWSLDTRLLSVRWATRSQSFWSRSKPQKVQKTHNIGDSLVVTDPNTDPVVVKLFVREKVLHSWKTLHPKMEATFPSHATAT